MSCKNRDRDHENTSVSFLKFSGQIPATPSAAVFLADAGVDAVAGVDQEQYPVPLATRAVRLATFVETSLSAGGQNGTLLVELLKNGQPVAGASVIYASIATATGRLTRDFQLDYTDEDTLDLRVTPSGTLLAQALTALIAFKTRS
jgi:hypothetical protein